VSSVADGDGFGAALEVTTLGLAVGEASGTDGSTVGTTDGLGAAGGVYGVEPVNEFPRTSDPVVTADRGLPATFSMAYTTP
jgi:hypothetical protein